LSTLAQQLLAGGEFAQNGLVGQDPIRMVEAMLPHAVMQWRHASHDVQMEGARCGS